MDKQKYPIEIEEDCFNRLECIGKKVAAMFRMKIDTEIKKQEEMIVHEIRCFGRNRKTTHIGMTPREKENIKLILTKRLRVLEERYLVIGEIEDEHVHNEKQKKQIEQNSASDSKIQPIGSQKLYKCQLCIKCFESLTRYTNHMWRIHNFVRKRTFRCFHCPSTGMSPIQSAQHLLKKHGVMKDGVPCYVEQETKRIFRENTLHELEQYIFMKAQEEFGIFAQPQSIDEHPQTDEKEVPVIVADNNSSDIEICIDDI